MQTNLVVLVRVILKTNPVTFTRNISILRKNPEIAYKISNFGDKSIHILDKSSKIFVTKVI